MSNYAPATKPAFGTETLFAGRLRIQTGLTIFKLAVQTVELGLERAINMATAIKVDLATTIIPRNHKVWKLFPGEGYKFLNVINETKTAFLDVRGLGSGPIKLLARGMIG